MGLVSLGRDYSSVALCTLVRHYKRLASYSKSALYESVYYIYAVNKKGVSCTKQGVSRTKIAFLFKCSYLVILLSFIKFWFRKSNFCVQAMSQQYLDVCFYCFFVRGRGGACAEAKIWSVHFARFNFSRLSLAFILKYYPILHVVKR